MPNDPQETKLENFKVRTQAKAKAVEVVRAIEAKRGIKPTLSEALVIMADHFLATAA